MNPQVLINDDTTANDNSVDDPTTRSTTDGASDGEAFLSQIPTSTSAGGVAQDYTYGRNANYTPRHVDGVLRSRETNGSNSHAVGNDDYSYVNEADTFWDGASGNNDSQPKSHRQQYEKFCKRTILLASLPDGVTHSDIVNVVKGGLILDIYLRTHDKLASVSFLEASAAQEFFRHVKRHDLYIRGKRVSCTMTIQTAHY